MAKRCIAVSAVFFAISLGTLSCGSDSGGDRTAPPGAYPPPDAASAAGQVRLAEVALFDDSPTSMVAGPEGQLFLAVRSGVVYHLPILAEDGYRVPGRPSVAIDLSQDVLTSGTERGMFDMLYLGKDLLAVSYTDGNGSVVVRLLRVAGEAILDDVPNPILVETSHPFGGHNGGGMASAANGDVLLGLGDMGYSDGPEPLSQDDSDPLGGIVRIPSDVISQSDERPYMPNTGDMVALGLRNPWRIERDPQTDDLWIGDVGEDQWEEVNLIESVTSAHNPSNFGWPAFEGSQRTGFEEAPVDPGFEVPIYEYEHPEGGCAAITGGGIYSGRQLEGLRGQYLFADACTGDLWALDRPESSARPAVQHLATAESGIISIEEDDDGERYVLLMSGQVLRLDPPSWEVGPLAGDPVQVTVAEDEPISRPTDAECKLVSDASILGRLLSASPEESRILLAQIISSIDLAIEAAPEGRVALLERLRVQFSQLSNLAADDPEAFESAVALAQGPDSPFPTLLDDVAEMLNRYAACSE